jgi:hypothetical protein
MQDGVRPQKGQYDLRVIYFAENINSGPARLTEDTRPLWRLLQSACQKLHVTFGKPLWMMDEVLDTIRDRASTINPWSVLIEMCFLFCAVQFFPHPSPKNLVGLSCIGNSFSKECTLVPGVAYPLH